MSGDDETRREALARELCALICTCSIDELRAFGVIARKVMTKGRESYGPTVLATDKRDFLAEAGDEFLDAIWYVALHVVSKHDQRLERLRCEAADEIAARIEPGLRELIENAADTTDEVTPLPPAPSIPRTRAMDFDTSDEEPR